MFKNDLLKNKRILVTGGGTGLGKEMATHYAEHGADIFICGRRENVLKDTAAEIEDKYDVKVSYESLDIRASQDVDSYIQRIFDDGPLDGLVNNAAGNFISPTKDLSHKGFDAIANIVFHGTFYMTQSVGKRWIESNHKGSIISILATWVWTGSPYVVPSAMSKSGLNAMTQSLAAEWGKYGIRVNAIAPGPFPTKGAWERLNPNGEDGSIMGENPMGRVGEMLELQNLATFLMADGCEYLTGQTIAIDGAQYLTGGGTFSNLSKLSEDDWEQMRNMIRSSNNKDKADR
ncbi:SDR family oxidoreductase [Gammaproteobacteria bacterium]|mgnify:FL=1|jgi:NAD(P)-dependent dehydrogenase (short-subunit alcohol dehydrogenase family)|nr:SDR family oxidoreductase [Gammaproteobacteria bacterium]MDA7844138.1 SDR family oxidoreductase [Gammaproteobacteria bacterium]MDA8933547.1 SDR family oxidoreductase [Gammaproteobacteria bacterium]MDA9039978.1 SDR family oxidoreductase [Gammaproteobacteria bacterium]MDA9315087.1 SDR family oxidoreductase [Gammaproteobacteria bacterium]|tara:strand:- start:3150 stop:4016 length:867 start_codon:yes stop_codon:yes gene_type:complete